MLNAKVRDAIGAPFESFGIWYTHMSDLSLYNSDGEVVAVNSVPEQRYLGSGESVVETLKRTNLNLTVCNSSDLSDNRLVDPSRCTQEKTDPLCIDTIFVTCKRALTCPKYCLKDADCMSSAFCNNPVGGQGRCTVRLEMCSIWKAEASTNLLASDASTCYTRSSLGEVCEHTSFLFKIDRWGMLKWALPLEQATVTPEILYWKRRAEATYSDLMENIPNTGDQTSPDNRKSVNSLRAGSNHQNNVSHSVKSMWKLSSH